MRVFSDKKCIKKPRRPLTSGSLCGAVPPEGKKIVRQKLGAKELVSFGLIKLSFCWKYLKKIIKFVYLHSSGGRLGSTATGPTTSAACPKRRVVKFQVIDDANKYRIV